VRKDSKPVGLKFENLDLYAISLDVLPVDIAFLQVFAAILFKIAEIVINQMKSIVSFEYLKYISLHLTYIFENLILSFSHFLIINVFQNIQILYDLYENFRHKSA
jgi:hypothetical protein